MQTGHFCLVNKFLFITSLLFTPKKGLFAKNNLFAIYRPMSPDHNAEREKKGAAWLTRRRYRGDLESRADLMEFAVRHLPAAAAARRHRAGRRARP